MQDNQINEIMAGTLLGDGCIFLDRGKYGRYKTVAKDTKFLGWLESLFNQFSINCFITHDNKISNTFALNIYFNTSPFPHFAGLRGIWYKKEDGKTIKTVPKDLELTPTVLLHWYLGDGSLIRMKNDRVPRIVLATNSFQKEDLQFLTEKLKELQLDFYPIASNSGFNKGKKCGYVLNSNTQDGTPFRFFKLIGLGCPKEIADCITGRKGRGSKLHYFKDKWPNEEDWIRILSNTNGIGKIIKERRMENELSQGKLAKKIGINRDSLKRIERGKRFPSVTVFKKLLNVIDINSSYLMEKLNRD